ncbi:MAG TPA: ribbon-helix-helix domain-containing protein [Gaiellaceae bacterium]|nr:ribbon-helix-helix domain-containing protein [Gaiellaceae bacterium]
MVRTQIHLSDDDIERLDAEARRTGASRSELIRRAIRARYPSPAKRGKTPDERRAAILAAAGAWRDRTFTGEEYTRAIRSGDMNENLRRLERR